MFLGEMCVLSLMYSYVTEYRFCVVCYLIIISFSFLVSNYLTCVFNFFRFVFCFVFLLSILCLLCFYIVECIVSLFVLSVSYFCTRVPTTDTGWKPNCSK